MNKVSTVISKMVDLLGVSATKTTILETLTNHPHYPSLLAVRDTLLSIKMPNTSFSLNENHLTELPTPCIAHVKDGYKEEFTIIKAIDENKVISLKDNQHWVTESVPEFKKRWSGVAMLVEATETSGEINYLEARIKELINSMRNPLLIILISFLVARIFLYQIRVVDSLVVWLMLFIKTIGTSIGILLMTELVNGKNYINKICGINANINCSSILKSSQAKLWGVISWSELVFVYYVGGFLWLAMSPQKTDIFGMLFYLNFLTLPFTFYSVYFQFFTQRKICIICTSVILLSWLEFYLLLPYYNRVNVSWDFINLGVIGFLSPIALWGLFKPLIEKYKGYQKQIQAINKLKYNPDYFVTILQKQEKSFPLDGIKPLILGNPAAANSLTIVTNPSCGPCRKLHEDIAILTEQTPDIKCNLIFAVGNDPKKEKHQLAQYFVSANENNELKKNLLDSWYKGKDLSFSDWQKHNQNHLSISADALSIINDHSIWCNAAKIKGTPTIYFNGYKLPHGYEVKDLKAIVSSLNNQV